MYTIRVEVVRGAEVRHSTDTVDRIFYLAQEWIKQPRTRSVTVTNPNGRQVFHFSR